MLDGVETEQPVPANGRITTESKIKCYPSNMPPKIMMMANSRRRRRRSNELNYNNGGGGCCLGGWVVGWLGGCRVGGCYYDPYARSG